MRDSSVTNVLGGDVTLASLEASRGQLELAILLGAIGTGVPELIGEVGTALWLTIVGARALRQLTPAAAPAG